MGIFQNMFKGKEQKQFHAQPMTILMPVEGFSMPLDRLPDEIFASETLGKGCGIEPSGNTVYAPFNGTVTQVAETKHAIGMESTDGIEVLIHIGMDTVEMNGKGFTALVKQGDSVKAGTPLLKIDLKAIKTAGHPIETAVVVTNSDEFSNVMLTRAGNIELGEPLLTVG